VDGRSRTEEQKTLAEVRWLCGSSDVSSISNCLRRLSIFGLDLVFRHIWQLHMVWIQEEAACYRTYVIPVAFRTPQNCQKNDSSTFWAMRLLYSTSLAPQLRLSHRTELVCNDQEMQDAWPAPPSSLLHRRSDCRPAATQHPAIGASIGQQMIRIPFDAASCSPEETKAAFNQTIWL
jgi:hypothetical protein